MMKSKVCLTAWMLAAAVQVAGAAPGSSAAEDREYYIGPRDVLAVTLFTADRSSQMGGVTTLEVPVNSAGSIIIPLVGKQQAGGLTPEQLEARLVRSYRTFVKDPQVSVTVSEFRARTVNIVGQVTSNGEIPLRHSKTTLFEIIAEAGGFVGTGLEGADRRNLLVRRGSQKIRVDFLGNAISPEGARNFLVEDGDQIFVPTPLNRIHLLGGVGASQEMELTPGMTLLQAVAKAGSFTEKSRRERIKILRRGGPALHIDGTRIFRGRDTDIALMPGDVVYVAEW